MSDGSYRPILTIIDETHVLVTPRPNYMMRPQIDRMISVLGEVADERVRQHHKWQEQDHPNGTDDRDQNVHNANTAKWLTDAHAKAGTLTWRDILDEEVQEAFAEHDPPRLRAELIQVAAVASAWVEAIDRRDDA